jgi:uncharacterized membrane protein YecN with MAPEG domain
VTPLIAIVMLIAILEYLVFLMLVGQARGRFKVVAPAVSGHPDFERYFRVQQNTLEVLVPFLPALWLFARYADATWGASLGAIFVIGRAWYAYGYIQDASRRGAGFGLSFLALITLVLGGIAGAGLELAG